MGGTETANLYSGFSEPLLPLPYLVVLVFVALPVSALIGFLIGQVEFRRRKYDEVEPEQIPGATALGAMLALLGLLLGFAFSSALGLREERQAALVTEATAISTAFMTADLLGEPGRSDLKTQILVYAQTRIATPADIQSSEAWNAFLTRTLGAQAQLWPTTLRAMGDGTSDPVRVAVSRSVTDMLDAHSFRLAAAAQQIPAPAKLLIFFASVAAIFVVGNRSALQGRQLTWRTFVFAGLLSFVMVVIIDLDNALQGTMKVNPDTLLETIRAMESAVAAPAN